MACEFRFGGALGSLETLASNRGSLSHELASKFLLHRGHALAMDGVPFAGTPSKTKTVRRNTDAPKPACNFQCRCGKLQHLLHTGRLCLKKGRVLTRGLHHGKPL